MASVTAGFKCPPDTPPDTKMPNMTARPKPQLMLKKSPKAPRLSVFWATDASPNTYYIGYSTLSTLMNVALYDFTKINKHSILNKRSPPKISKWSFSKIAFFTSKVIQEA